MSIPLKVMWGGMKGEQKRDQVQTQPSRPGAAVELLDDQGVVGNMLQNASRDKGIHAVALKREHPQIAHHIYGQGDGTSVDVDLVPIPADVGQLLAVGQDLGGEGRSLIFKITYSLHR